LLENEENDVETAVRNTERMIAQGVDVVIFFQPVEALGHIIADRLSRDKATITDGSGNLTWTVTDSSGKSDTTTCTIVVVGSPINLDCGPCSAGKAYVGKAYNASMAVTGGKGPYTFSILSGTLPAGLTLNAFTGVIGGTPTAAATTPGPP